MGSFVSHYVVPRVLANAYRVQTQVQAIHDAWDRHQQTSERAPSTVSNHSAKPLARARERPDQGIRHNPQLRALAAASRRGRVSLPAPVTCVPSAAASAFAPAINVGAPGIGGVASTFSSVMTTAVKPITNTTFEKSNDPVRAGRTLAIRQRQNLARFMLPMLRVV
jgi:hypothetical protein